MGVRCEKGWYGANIDAVSVSKALAINSSFLTVSITLSANKVVLVRVKVP